MDGGTQHTCLCAADKSAGHSLAVCGDGRVTVPSRWRFERFVTDLSGCYVYLAIVKHSLNLDSCYDLG